ncbi:ribosome biogenesis protein BOP1 homolog [Lathyrus oleraceus]|uniref:Ribosome biogenesis protein BOP1 homolog n=1 Tax=Pisum sativum TaxID=3888 RepID=A0A9D5APJ2_PEA|nr:ribosome biogenesis protein BOP1 homolog [Pisum sativum]KAI5414756.1 Ribosome biogenesis protein 1 [Pisum sativum]
MKGQGKKSATPKSTEVKKSTTMDQKDEEVENQKEAPVPSDSDDSDYEYFSGDSDEDSSESLDSQSESAGSGELEEEDDDNSGDSEDAESQDEDDVNSEGGSESSDLHQGGGVESDSSEDEVAPRNTIGEVPLKWYADEPHIGYDITGKKIKKKEKADKLDSFLKNVDDSKNWWKIYDDYNDEVVELTKDEIKMVRRLIKNGAPHSDFDPYPAYVDWFKWDDAKHPLSNAPEPKRRFIPSKWEAKKVVQYVRAIRKGLITFDKPKEVDGPYLLWEDDSGLTEKANHLAYIPAPKQKLPGHDESYNPPLEYIPTQEEINSYQLMFEEDRPKFIPKSFASMRSIPAYENALKEAFERCLDLYLCPRIRKKRLNIDPESLKPKLPSKKELKPYPITCYIEFKGHEGAVTSISVEASGQWMASGSSDGTVRVWEVETGRCLRRWEVGEAVSCVAWNPLSDIHILAVSAGQDVLLLNTCLGDEEEQKKIKELLCAEPPKTSDDTGTKAPSVSWVKDDKHEGIRLKHLKAVTAVEWHRKGDYFSTVMPKGESRSVLIHQLSKKATQKLPFKLRGIAVRSTFHPSRSIFFICTQKSVRVYDLLKSKLIKKLDTGLKEASSIAVHPGGDNLIVGSKEGKLCWFDMDLSSKPYKILKCHPKDINNVVFHRSYPLFATCSDDGTAYVFHGMVYSDLNKNPLIVPLEILRGHANSNGRGILDCKFHPRQPWLFTAGADKLIKLYCHH